MKPTKNRVFCTRCKRQKMVFETAEKAHNFIKFNSSEMLAEGGVAPVRAYYCEACGGWHVTSTKSPFAHITRISCTNNRARYFLKQGNIKEAAKELAKAQALWVEVVKKERVNHQLERVIKEIQKTRNALLECKENAQKEASVPEVSDNNDVDNEPSTTMRVLTETSTNPQKHNNMKLVVRQIYYKAVTPSCHIIDLDFDTWMKFLHGTLETRKEIACHAICPERTAELAHYTREIAWIPLDNQNLIVEASSLT